MVEAASYVSVLAAKGEGRGVSVLWLAEWDAVHHPIFPQELVSEGPSYCQKELTSKERPLNYLLLPLDLLYFLIILHHPFHVDTKYSYIEGSREWKV